MGLKALESCIGLSSHDLHPGAAGAGRAGSRGTSGGRGGHHQNYAGRGIGRGGGRGLPHAASTPAGGGRILPVPTEEFNFEEQNKKFDKSSILQVVLCLQICQAGGRSMLCRQWQVVVHQ